MGCEPTNILLRLGRELRLPPEYTIALDSITDCIVIYNDVWGFSLTPHWCREHSYEDIVEHVRYAVNYLIAKSHGKGVVSIQLTSALKNPPKETKFDRFSGVPFDKTEKWDALAPAREEAARARERLEINWDAVFGKPKSKWTDAQVEAAALVMSMALRNGEGPSTAERSRWNAIARDVLNAAEKAAEPIGGNEPYGA